MGSLRASSPFGGYREKYTRERHARGDATRGFAARSRVLARLASLAQIGEVARRLDNRVINQITNVRFVLTICPIKKIMSR